jgi:Sec-independent protein translocase protein TatA
MGLFSPVHILVVAVVALIVLGPEEMVKAMGAAGRAVGGAMNALEQLRIENPIEQLLDVDVSEPATATDSEPERAGEERS